MKKNVLPLLININNMKKIITLVSIVLLAVACIKDKPTPNNPSPTNVDGERVTMVTRFDGMAADTVKYVYENNKLVKVFSYEYEIKKSNSSTNNHTHKWNLLWVENSILIDVENIDYFNNDQFNIHTVDTTKDKINVVLNTNGTIKQLVGDDNKLSFEYSSNYLSKIFDNSDTLVFTWKDGNLNSYNESTYEYYLDKQNNWISIFQYIDEYHLSDFSYLEDFRTKNLVKKRIETNDDNSVDTYLYNYKFDAYNRVIEMSVQNEKDASDIITYKYTWSK